MRWNKNKCGPTYEDCEMALLKSMSNKAEKNLGREQLKDPTIQNIIKIVEQFLKDKKLIAYGGTAINNILPQNARFYDKETEFPDYDFFSPTPLKNAKELADIYHKEGYKRVEAKAGFHAGTFKVFVNFLPVADITYLEPELFQALCKEAIKVDGILYTPPDYLRMSMYLELSRPRGDPSRWEKVQTRLNLLNKYYPPQTCPGLQNTKHLLSASLSEDIFSTLANKEVIFFGHVPVDGVFNLGSWPRFDIIVLYPKNTAISLTESLKLKNYKNVKMRKHKNVGEVIPQSYHIEVDGKKVAFIYEPLGCHGYNMVNLNGKDIRIASIDTMLSLYLAFSYVNRKYYDVNRIVCLSSLLYNLQMKHRLDTSGPLARYSLTCFGHQSTMQQMREEKSKMFDELRKFSKKRVDNSKYLSNKRDYYFLKYDPAK